MKIRHTLPLLLTLGMVACAGGADDAAPEADAAPEMSADEQALAEMADYWATHYNMGHPDMVGALYAEGAWFLGSNGANGNGPEGIAAVLGANMGMSPQISITPGDIMVFGDHAVMHGTYELTATPEGGETVSWGGTYMTHSQKIDGEWKILGHISNLTEDPFEGFAWTSPEGEPEAPEEVMFAELTDQWETHYNMGHGSMVADFHTEDGMASFSRGGPQMGRAAIAEYLQAQIDQTGLQLDINELGHEDLGNGWALVGGWWAGTPPDANAPAQYGGYFNLARQQDDGSWLIHWSVSNSWPADAM